MVVSHVRPAAAPGASHRAHVRNTGHGDAARGWFWLGLTFGKDSGWARYVLAAGECTVRYRGADYHLEEPVVIEGATVRNQLPPVMRSAMALVGIHDVLRLKPVAG